GADREVDAVADRGVAGPADADDPAILDPDIGLDDADRGIDDDRPDHHRVELGWPGVAALGQPDAEILGVAPDRLVAGCLEVSLDADPQVGIAEPDAIAGARAEAGSPGPGG